MIKRDPSSPKHHKESALLFSVAHPRLDERTSSKENQSTADHSEGAIFIYPDVIDQFTILWIRCEDRALLHCPSITVLPAMFIVATWSFTLADVSIIFREKCIWMTLSLHIRSWSADVAETNSIVETQCESWLWIYLPVRMQHRWFDL